MFTFLRYILEVDLECHKEQYDLLNDLPLATESLDIILMVWLD